MKSLNYILLPILFILTTNSYASVDNYIKVGKNTKINLNNGDLNKTLDSFTKSAKEDLTKKIDIEFQKLQDSANKNMTIAVDNFNTKIEDLNDRVNNNIVKKGEDLVKRAESEFNSILAIKQKVSKYIFIVKIVLLILFLSILVLLFILWKWYSKIQNIANGALNIGNLAKNGDLDKKLAHIEKKLDEIILKLGKIK